MDAIISIARKLDLANMNFTLVFVLAGLFVAFIYVLFKCLIQQFSLKLLTKEKVKLRFLLIPTTLSLMLNVGLLSLSYFILTKLNINTLQLFENLLLKFEYDVNHLIFVIIAFFISEAIFILISALIYRLKDFNLWYYIKLLFFMLKKDNEKVQYLKSTKKVPIKLEYSQGIISCLFSFAIIFFLAVILIYCGTLLGRNVFVNIDL